MGLIRSGQTALTSADDEQLTDYLWPIVREIIKTVIENEQNLIVEGCYIPFDQKNDFEKCHLYRILYCCLVMSERLYPHAPLRHPGIRQCHRKTQGGRLHHGKRACRQRQDAAAGAGKRLAVRPHRRYLHFA